MSQYDDVKNARGGLSRLLDVLISRDIDFDYCVGKPKWYLSITSRYGKLGAYDRIRECVVRMDIPASHPLAECYKEYGGYLGASKQTAKGKVQVFFDPKDFEELADYIRNIG